MRRWVSEDQAEAERLQRELDLLQDITVSARVVQEYPDLTGTPDKRASRSMKGRDRNDPCPCGSGRKRKRCCG